MPYSTRHLLLPDGRTLAVHQSGPEGAPAMVFLGGAGLAGVAMLPDPPEDIRLVAIDRPGLGTSSHDPSRTFASLAADIDVAAAQLDALPYAAIGFSQGAPFALALSAYGSAAAVALVSPQDEFAHPSMLRLAAPEITPFVAFFRADPDAAESNLALGMSPETLKELFTRTASPADVAFYTDPDRADALDQSLAEGFMNGADGYARDCRLALSTWPSAFFETAVPVRIWCGKDDRRIVHSPDHGALLARRLKNAHRRVLVGGSTVLWTERDTILCDLNECFTAATAGLKAKT